MLVDIVNPGWAPVYQSNLTEDVQGYITAPPRRLPTRGSTSPAATWARLGTREDIAVHQRYMADIVEHSRKALDTVDPTPYFVRYGVPKIQASYPFLRALRRSRQDGFVALGPALEECLRRGYIEGTGEQEALSVVAVLVL